MPDTTAGGYPGAAMPPLAAFEAVDPSAPQRPAVPVAELTALEPGEPSADLPRWYPLCCGCGRPWGPGLAPAAWLVTLPKRQDRRPVCRGCAESERARQAVQRRFLSGAEIRVAGPS